MTDIHTLRALLMEAREPLKAYWRMMQDCEDLTHSDLCVCGEAARTLDLFDRIEEALAESDVRWNSPEFTGSKRHTVIVNGYYIVVAPTPLGVTWQAFPQERPYKEAFLPKKTVEEAKEAALIAVGWRKP